MLQLVWDEIEAWEYDVAELMEGGMSRDEAEERANTDAAWDFFCAELTEEMNRINPEKRSWKATGINMGWRQTNGEKFFPAVDATELLLQILPHTNCTFVVKIDRRRKCLTVSNNHHDAPATPEVYEIRPMSRLESKLTNLVT